MRIDGVSTGLLAAILVVAAALVVVTGRASAAEPYKVLIIDGENPYHDWQMTTPILKKILEDSGRFTVEVMTIEKPTEGEAPDDAAWTTNRKFKDFDAVLSNYNSQTLPPEKVKQEFLDYVRGGGAFVCVHAANNSFAQWPEYNEIAGLGGWYGRDKSWGPYVYYKDDKLVVDSESDGPCGHHGPPHEYTVRIRDAEHPITKGLPAAWKHTKDELYDCLRGPAKNMEVLATAYSDKAEHQGTDRDEPMLLTLKYGDGRIFHTIMGHDDVAMACVGFQTTLLRGTEWAITGEATIPVPEDFPTEEELSSRE